MEIKTKYNVGDKVWIMRNNKPEKIQISNIEVEVIGDVPVGTCSLSGEHQHSSSASTAGESVRISTGWEKSRANRPMDDLASIAMAPSRERT